MMKTYKEFLLQKSHSSIGCGFQPFFLPDCLFDFQQHIVSLALQRGRAAIFADCGMGKTLMQLVWAHNVAYKTNKPVLILTPLAVGAQTVMEGHRFGIACSRSRDGQFSADEKIVITNYEQLHRFNSQDFAGVVCDESSILKHFTGATQKNVTRFLLKIPYRLLCTATAAPNDYPELGTSSEALGELGYQDMLTRFFRKNDKQAFRMRDVRLKKKAMLANIPTDFQQLLVDQSSEWRLKGHAVTPFWRWVASWAMALRKPSDLGFPDKDFILPPVVEQEHIVRPSTLPDGSLFDLPAFGFHEEREERKRSLVDRCSYVAELANHDNPVVIWCHLNDEGDMLEKMIPKSRQVCGADSDEKKESTYQDFISGALRVLIIKPKIGAWGMNWQHCAHVITFATHSYEQYYQSIRRCWRFGQKRSVCVDIVITEGERRIANNMLRKARQADAMFQAMLEEMHQATIVQPRKNFTTIEVPSWL
jgi:hypothetical protein